MFYYNVIMAKVRGMYGKMLKEKQYDELILCKTVSSIASYLKNNTTYAKMLKGIDESSIHRNQLEVLIKKNVFENYAKLYRYVIKKKDTIFKMIFDEFELLEILRMILLIKTKQSNQYIISLPVFLAAKCDIDLFRLAKVKNYSELVDFLENTKYHKILLKNFPKNGDNTIDYTSCEHDLYMQYFSRFFKLIKSKHKKTEKFELIEMLGSKLDYLNLSIIYRDKILFRSTENELKNHVFPFSKRLTKVQLQNLVVSTDKSTLKDVFNKFGIDIASGNSRTNMKNVIENKVYRCEHKICKKYLHVSVNSPSIFYAFYVLSQIEILNLTYIIEGVRYSRSPSEIKQLLVV